MLRKILVSVVLTLYALTSAGAQTPVPSSDLYIRQVDELSALWSFYKQKYIVSVLVQTDDSTGHDVLLFIEAPQSRQLVHLSDIEVAGRDGCLCPG